MPEDPDPATGEPVAGRRLHPLAGGCLFIFAVAALTVLLPFGRSPDEIFDEAVSSPPAASPELPRGTWVGIGNRSLTEPGMWVDGQEGNAVTLRLTLQSPGFGTAATVRVEVGEGENRRANWTSRVEAEPRNGRLSLRFADGERWRLDPSGDELRLTVMESRREGIEGESFVLGLRQPADE